MTPASKPQEMTGVNENKWIFGNRFIYEDVKGADPKMPFEGIGILGYDNAAEAYTTIWLDNMSTGIMTGTAQYDPKTQTFAEKGTFSCPLTPKQRRRYHAVCKIIDDNHYTYEMYMTDPASGKEFKSMEISYTRAKS